MHICPKAILTHPSSTTLQLQSLSSLFRYFIETVFQSLSFLSLMFNKPSLLRHQLPTIWEMYQEAGASWGKKEATVDINPTSWPLSSGPDTVKSPSRCSFCLVATVYTQPWSCFLHLGVVTMAFAGAPLLCPETLIYSLNASV